MYTSAAGVSGAGFTGALATSGLTALAWTVAASTLLFAGLALMKILPRRRRGTGPA
ncbi:hypothetical protein ABZ135_09180 [Streptomyces sp. NPDC006339]|uniref:hypothetical protein n=1 Tax=Streptomyces sp. NPDC006339 TaxID=3156755 RepID=UPI0033A8C053